MTVKRPVKKAHGRIVTARSLCRARCDPDSRQAPGGVITYVMDPEARLTLPPSFEEALSRHEREIMRFLLRMTRDQNDALDLFQETWLRA
ncbi:MAG: sigma factor, partial [Candidatus Binataceae bacterium]